MTGRPGPPLRHPRSRPQLVPTRGYNALHMFDTRPFFTVVSLSSQTIIRFQVHLGYHLMDPCVHLKRRVLNQLLFWICVGYASRCCVSLFQNTTISFPTCFSLLQKSLA